MIFSFLFFSINFFIFSKCVLSQPLTLTLILTLIEKEQMRPNEI
jgi:hypothetical protein